MTVLGLQAVSLDGEDREADPLGVKGLGGVLHVGVAPTANANRVRQLTITAEALL
ncbi:hypothetical protein [Streptomyces californicus]|uniref:hypothetical protein n=1 Tax=Streptomyces californicus TaxID=67351 RepID=UPI00332E4FED